MSSLAAWHHEAASQRLDPSICYGINVLELVGKGELQPKATFSTTVADTLSFADIGLPAPVGSTGVHCDSCLSAQGVHGLSLMISGGTGFSFLILPSESSLHWVLASEPPHRTAPHTRPLAQAPPVIS